MKKFIAGMLIGMLLMTGVSYGNQLIAQVVDYKIMVNGQQKQLTEKPLSINNRTYLPVRAVAEMLGYQVNFDGNKGLIYLDNVVVETKPKTITLNVDGSIVIPDVVPVIKGEDVYVPLGVFAKMASIQNIVWDDGKQQVTIVMNDKTYIGIQEQIVSQDRVLIPLKKVMTFFGHSCDVTETEDTININVKTK